MAKGVIYRHWLINDKGIEKSYIGKHNGVNPQKRWGNDGYRYLTRDSNSKFARAIKKYGWNSFHHEIIGIVEADTKKQLNKDLNEWELYYIDKYNSFYNGYNSTLGGEGTVGRLHTEEEKRKIGERSKGRNIGLKRSEETRHRISEARKGYKHTQEAKKNMSKAQQDINKRGLNGNAKKVICLNTLQIFDCMANGGEWCGLKTSQKIGECCRKSRKSAGKHPITKERLHWMYYDEWLKLNNENSDSNAEYIA